MALAALDAAPTQAEMKTYYDALAAGEGVTAAQVKRDTDGLITIAATLTNALADTIHAYLVGKKNVSYGITYDSATPKIEIAFKVCGSTFLTGLAALTPAAE